MQHKKKIKPQLERSFSCFLLYLLFRNAHYSDQWRPEGLDIIITTCSENKIAIYYSSVCPSLSFSYNKQDIKDFDDH